MSSAAPTTETKRAEPKGEAKSKAERTEINRRNARKSTGPRTAEGKARSRYNAVKHGMTAESTIMPGEDATAFEARVCTYHQELQPCNSAERDAIDCIVRDVWLANRAHGAAVKRVTGRLRHRAEDIALAERDQAIALGDRLFAHKSRPLPLKPADDPATTDDYIRYVAPGSPDHPARLLLRLESTVAGCDWLLARWHELAQAAGEGQVWQASDGFKAIRLVGKRASDVADDREVGVIMLSTIALTRKPEPTLEDFWDDDPPAGYNSGLGVFDHKAHRRAMHGQAETEDEDEIEATLQAYEIALEQYSAAWKSLDDKWCRPFRKRLERSPWNKMKPADANEAARWMAKLASEHIRRLEALSARNQRRDDADAADAPALLAVEPGHEGDLDRRYTLSRDRAVHRSFHSFLKLRKASASGELPDAGADDAVEPAETENGFVPVEAKERHLQPVPMAVPAVALADWCDRQLDDLPPSGPSGHLPPRRGEGDAPDKAPPGQAEGSGPENGAPRALFRNEATDQLVRCPSSVVSGERVPDEPSAAQAPGGSLLPSPRRAGERPAQCAQSSGPTSGHPVLEEKVGVRGGPQPELGSAPLSGPSGHLPPRRGEGSPANEAICQPKNLTNELAPEPGCAPGEPFRSAAQVADAARSEPRPPDAPRPPAARRSPDASGALGLANAVRSELHPPDAPRLTDVARSPDARQPPDSARPP
jgi:hypothetical protein